MNRLIKSGEVLPKKPIDIRHSRIGLGFEKLDRNVFDPEKAYPFVAESGVKLARLQSGWQRTERQKGVYDFAWLDSIVDNLLAIGVEPWLCLCYGNDLYSEEAKIHFGAVGVPPIRTAEEREAWQRYVKATVTHFKGRIHYYEVWNEPDGKWCWKHGPNAEELGAFTIATAKACKEADPSCEVLGFALCSSRSAPPNFLNDLAKSGAPAVLDGITYHSYNPHDRVWKERYHLYDQIRKEYNPKLKIIQGETGTQSRYSMAGALKFCNWTPLKQAKFLLRHLLVDLGEGCEFASYFSCIDMIEALNGKVGDVASYLDFGYFGVLGADFDENGRCTGAYTPKPSFKALQNLCSIFCNEYEEAPFPAEGVVLDSQYTFDPDFDFNQTIHYSYQKPNGARGMVYWNPKNILTETYEGTLSLQLTESIDPQEIRITDLLSGTVYTLPESMVEGNLLKNIPVTDFPLLITIGDFLT